MARGRSAPNLAAVEKDKVACEGGPERTRRLGDRYRPRFRPRIHCRLQAQAPAATGAGGRRADGGDGRVRFRLACLNVATGVFLSAALAAAVVVAFLLLRPGPPLTLVAGLAPLWPAPPPETPTTQPPPSATETPQPTPTEPSPTVAPTAT